MAGWYNERGLLTGIHNYNSIIKGHSLQNGLFDIYSSIFISTVSIRHYYSPVSSNELLLLLNISSPVAILNNALRLKIDTLKVDRLMVKLSRMNS